MFCLLKEGPSIFPFLLEKIDYNLSENLEKTEEIFNVYIMNMHLFMIMIVALSLSLSFNAELFESNGVCEIHFIRIGRLCRFSYI